VECIDVPGLAGGAMNSRIIRFSIWLVIAFIGLIAFLAVVTNVATKPTDIDIAVFRSVLGLEKPSEPISYEQELQLIKQLQAVVLREAPGNEPIPDFQDREPEDLFKAKSGLCFDRSRTFDKLFYWYGFETRHIYILYSKHPITGEHLSFWRAFITKGTQSHAVTEVKTSRGWLVVDSNTPWISVAEDGTPVDADHIRLQVDQFQSIPEYWNRPYWSVRGLYSRRGQLYRPYIPFPEMNWHDFISWLVKG